MTDMTFEEARPGDRFQMRMTYGNSRYSPIFVKLHNGPENNTVIEGVNTVQRYCRFTPETTITVISESLDRLEAVRHLLVDEGHRRRVT